MDPQGEVRVVSETFLVGASRPKPLAGGKPPRPPVGDVGTNNHHFRKFPRRAGEKKTFEIFKNITSI